MSATAASPAASNPFADAKAAEASHVPALKKADSAEKKVPSRIFKKTFDFKELQTHKRIEQAACLKDRRAVHLHMKNIDQALKKPGNGFINFFDVVLKIDVLVADQAIQRLMESKPERRPLIQSFIDRYMQSMVDDDIKQALASELDKAGCNYNLDSIQELMGNLHI